MRYQLLSDEAGSKGVMGGFCVVEAKRHKEFLREGLQLLGQVGGDLQMEFKDEDLGIKGSGLGLVDLQA